MRGDVVWRGLAWAVTPVHVGAGETWTKQDYVVRNGQLCRIDPARVVARMDPARRREFERAVDTGNLQGAHRLLVEAVRDDDIRERIPLGPASARELKTAQEDARRWGEVMPFIRTGGRPFIPGSSIKGAIRTALLNAVVQERGLDPARRAIRDAGSRASDQLQEWAFGYDGRHTEQDPFRFVEVADVALPEGATRIDRVVNWNPRGGTSNRIQMHVERLRCRLDGPSLRFQIEIRLDLGGFAAASERDLDRRRRRTPAWAPNEEQLRRAINRFYFDRYMFELEKFFDEDRRLIDSLFSVKIDGVVLSIDKLVNRNDFLLLRIGRFTQFESKSIDGLRCTRNINTKDIITEGKTRNILEVMVRNKDGSISPRHVPFGWILVSL